MKFSINIVGWSARAPGLKADNDWLAWAQQSKTINSSAPLEKLTNLPMMIARRLNSGSRLALDAALELYSRYQPDALLFTCRHGELERNFRILTSLAKSSPLSPTDFAMSVHNSAVGNLAIMLKTPLITTSLSAGKDTFHQGIIEALALLNDGFKRVLLVDFDGEIPEFYRPHTSIHWPFSCAFVVEKGSTYRCHFTTQDIEEMVDYSPSPLTQSLDFLRCYLAEQEDFRISSRRSTWHWQIKGK